MATSAVTGTGALDVAGIVNALMNVERVPLTRLEDRIGAVTSRVSSMGSFIAKVSVLRAALDNLSNPVTFALRQTASSDSGLVTASAGPNVALGALDVQVQQTARAQTLRYDAAGWTSADAAVSDGTLVFTLPDASEVNVSAEGDTLATLAAKISDSAAGVQATVIQTGDASYGLLLTGRSTGASAGAFTVTGDAAVLGFDNHKSGAADAAILVNGVRYTRSGNSFDNVLPGLSLTLQRQVAAADPAEPFAGPAGPTARITIGQNGSGAEAIQGLVTAYNEVFTLYQQLTAANRDATQRGPLNADAALNGFMTQVRSMLLGYVYAGDGASSAERVRLADAGVTTAENGTLVVNASQLQAALSGTLGDVLAAGAKVASAAGWSDTTGAPAGVATLRQFMAGALASGGVLRSRQDGLLDTITQLNAQKTRLNDRLALAEQRFLRTYTSLDTQLSRASQVSSSLAQALDALAQQTRPRR
jgi:flagellar hook-associated protein 2